MKNWEKWLDALESGRYKQGVEWLRYGDCYCCLGVACEVYQQEVGGLSINSICPSEDFIYDGLSDRLPKIVREWFGLSHEGESILIDANDVANLTFPQIAIYIRQHADEMFTEVPK